MRAALLPAGADPFLNAYWLRHYRQWADEVDELRVIVCGQRDEEVREYTRECVAAVPHASVEFLDDRTDHGIVMGMLFRSTQADHVLFCEDDVFIRHAGVVDLRFRVIESGQYDVIGCPRGSASENLINAATAKYGEPEDMQTGESGLSLYPAPLFAPRELLARTDGNFSARWWPADVYLPELDVFTVEGDSADTFADTTWQLRAMGARILAEPAYRSASRGGEAPWFHVGSLSSGYGCAFMSPMPPHQLEAYYESIRPGGELYDWQKRAAWWTRVLDLWDGGIPEHHAKQKASLETFMDAVGMDRKTVNGWRQFFDGFITWPEM